MDLYPQKAYTNCSGRMYFSPDFSSNQRHLQRMALKLQIHRFAAAVLKTFSELSAERTREEVVEAKQFQPSKVLCSEKIP